MNQANKRHVSFREWGRACLFLYEGHGDGALRLTSIDLLLSRNRGSGGGG